MSELNEHEIVEKLIQEKSLGHNAAAEQLLPNSGTPVYQHRRYEVTDEELIKKNSNRAVQISKRLGELSLYREMKDFSETNFKLFLNLLGRVHSDTLSIEYLVAYAFDSNGEHKKALTKYHVLWEKKKEFFGNENEETLNIAHQIATVLYSLGRFDTAFEMQLQTLESRIKLLGKIHQSIMHSKNDIAGGYHVRGNIPDALLLYKEVLEWQKTNLLDPQHTDTLTTKNNIAVCLFNMKEFVKAKIMLEEVLGGMMTVYGEKHSQTLSTKSILALTFYFLGQENIGLGKNS